MRRFSAFCLLAFMMSAAAVAQQPLPDSVTFAAGQDCCFNFTVKNRNAQRAAISGVVFTVQSSNVDVRLIPTMPTAPAGWTMVRATRDSVYYALLGTSGAGLIRAGMQLSGFNICFNTMQSPYTVRWATFSSSGPISQGELALTCPVVNDNATPLRTQGCCFDWTVFNENSLRSVINDFHIEVLTRGVTVSSSGAPSGWTATQATNQRIEYSAPTGGGMIPSGQSRRGFVTCFTLPTTGLSSFRVRWRTTLNGVTISSGITTLQCDPATTSRDSVQVSGGNDCCYSMTVRNRNSQGFAIDNFTLTVLNSGVEVRPTPGAPNGWQVDAFDATSISWTPAAGGSTIGSGTSLAGFNACFDFPTGTAVPIQLLWRTQRGGTTISEEIVTVTCQAASACDTVDVSRSDDGSCCFILNLKNRRTPLGPVNGFNLRVLTPGSTISSAVGPWAVTSSNPTSVVFSGSALAGGNDLNGFRMCLDIAPTAPQPVRVVWETTLNGQVLCVDTLELTCEVRQTCDSMKVTARADCCHEFTLQNRHTPASPIASWQLDVLTPGVTIRPIPTAPATWSVSTLTSTTVIFTETGSGLPSGADQAGFFICFDNIPASGVVELRWCAQVPGAVPCCDTISVQCPPAPAKCDEVEIRTSDSSSCCWDYSIQNLHTPASPINDFHIRVLTTGVTVLASQLQAPTGWSRFGLPTAADFNTGTMPIQPNATMAGFRVCFDASQIQNAPFQIVWETTLNARVLCRDTVTLRCTTTGIEAEPGPKPTEFGLRQNYPNPFNPTTTIEFDVPHEADVELVVTDATGRTILTLARERVGAGRYSAVFDASGLPSGTYYARLRSGAVLLTRAMSLMK